MIDHIICSSETLLRASLRKIKQAMAEFIPIGTILAVISKQIIKTSNAAKDVVFEKESFKALSKHLLDIEPVLNELQSHQLNDSPAARQALESLESDLKKAQSLIEKYKARARFYLLIKCRHIVREIQEVTREIGSSLASLSLANVEVLSNISDRVHRLQDVMQRAEFESSQDHLQIVDKLNQGISDQSYDKEFANDMLKKIALAVGVPVEPTEISKELASFKLEKEEAENRKERAEVLFLEQVIELLSRADAARDYEEVRSQYLQRLMVIERYNPREEYIEPFRSFFCCITMEVMVDPVSLSTGTTCERSALEVWFERGEKIDPETREVLEDFSYRSNVQLRQSIQEWRELNYCVMIRSCKGKLVSGVDEIVGEGLDRMRELVRENAVNRDWISIGGLSQIAIGMIGAGGISKRLLVTLKDLVDGHARNKEIFIENHGIEKLVPCLGMDLSISMAAVELLYEVMLDRSGWNMTYCRMLSKKQDVIPLLVSFLKKEADETSTKKTGDILAKLCEVDDNVIIRAAEANWFRPLIDKVTQGEAPVRMSVVRELVRLELDQEKIDLLGKEGIIPQLLEMASGNNESMEVSLQALLKLSTSLHNKHLIASSNGLPLILNILSSSQKPVIVIAKCAEILANLSSNGTQFLVDENGTRLDLGPLITCLLSFQQNLNSFDLIRKPALRALLEIFRAEPGLVKSAVLSESGVSVILSLLDDANQEIRELAINILFLFSQHEPEGVVEYLLRPRRLEALVGFLEDSDKGNVQMAAAGLLANLPKSERCLTEKLIELGGLKAIIDIIKSGTAEAKENALSALFRFTDPTNLESQRVVVERGAYSLLSGLLKSDDSVTMSARAAALLGDLSMRSQELSLLNRKHSKWMCCFGARLVVCPAHGGACGVNTTFCLLEGNVLPDLVRLLQGRVHETAYEAIQTLSTLVDEDLPQRGANVLHEHGAIATTIEVLRWGTETLKGEALSLLDKVFVVRDMVEEYGQAARGPLTQLTGRSVFQDGQLQRKATRVLLLIERYSRSSTSLVVGSSD